MKLKTLITTFHNGELKPIGSVIELDETEAKTFIQRKFAERVEDAEIVEATQAESETEQATRQIGQPVETAEPEDLVGSQIEIPGVVGSFNVDSASDDGTLHLSAAEPATASEDGDTSEDIAQEEKPAKGKGKGK